MAKVYTWTVTGRGRFPIDMLRYDACYPVDSASAAALDETFPQGYGRVEPSPNPTSVTLRSRVGGPGEARWNTFGWKVSDKREERA